MKKTLCYDKLCFLFLIFFFSEISPWAQAAQVAVDIFGSVAKGIAEVKLKNQELKKENTQLHKVIVKTGDNSKVQVNNLFLVSNMKEEFAQRVSDYKDNHLLNLDDMVTVISNLYRNYVLLSKQFVKKCSKLIAKNNEKQLNDALKTLIRISAVGIKRVFLDYITLIESYNFESQNLIQIMLTNNLKENIFQKINVENGLVDVRLDLGDFLSDFESVLDNNDIKIGSLWTAEKLLQDSVIMTFNRQTKEILTTLQSIEEKQRDKDITEYDFFDISDHLEKLKVTLFSTFDNVDESTSRLENILFKMIFIFQVNIEKLQVIMNFINQAEDNKITYEADFLSSLYKEILATKAVIAKNKDQYVQTILKYQESFDFFKKIKDFIAIARKSQQNITSTELSSIIREYTKVILSQESEYTKFIEKIKDQCTQLFYMNKAMADLEETINNIKVSIKDNIEQGIESKKKATQAKEVLLANNTSIVNTTMNLGEVHGRGKKGGGRSQKRAQRSSGHQKKESFEHKDKVSHEGGSKKAAHSSARSSDHENAKNKERTGKTHKKSESRGAHGKK